MPESLKDLLIRLESEIKELKQQLQNSQGANKKAHLKFESYLKQSNEEIAYNKQLVEKTLSGFTKKLISLPVKKETPAPDLRSEIESIINEKVDTKFITNLYRNKNG